MNNGFIKNIINFISDIKYDNYSYVIFNDRNLYLLYNLLVKNNISNHKTTIIEQKEIEKHLKDINTNLINGNKIIVVDFCLTKSHILDILKKLNFNNETILNNNICFEGYFEHYNLEGLDYLSYKNFNCEVSESNLLSVSRYKNELNNQIDDNCGLTFSNNICYANINVYNNEPDLISKLDKTNKIYKLDEDNYFMNVEKLGDFIIHFNKENSNYIITPFIALKDTNYNDIQNLLKLIIEKINLPVNTKNELLEQINNLNLMDIFNCFTYIVSRLYGMILIETNDIKSEFVSIDLLPLSKEVKNILNKVFDHINILNFKFDKLFEAEIYKNLNSTIQQQNDYNLFENNLCEISSTVSSEEILDSKKLMKFQDIYNISKNNINYKIPFFKLLINHNLYIDYNLDGNDKIELFLTAGPTFYSINDAEISDIIKYIVKIEQDCINNLKYSYSGEMINRFLNNCNLNTGDKYKKIKNFITRVQYMDCYFKDAYLDSDNIESKYLEEEYHKLYKKL